MNDLLQLKGQVILVFTDIGTVFLRNERENHNADYKKNNQAEHCSRGFPGQLGGNGDEQRSHNRSEFPKNVVEAEEFIGVALWHELGEIRTAEGLNAALRGGDKHGQYPEIKRCLQKIGVHADNHINNDPDVQHCLPRKAFCQFSVYNGKRRGDDLGDKQDDQEACGADP